MCLIEETSRKAAALQCPDIPGMEMLIHVYWKFLGHFQHEKEWGPTLQADQDVQGKRKWVTEMWLGRQIDA